MAISVTFPIQAPEVTQTLLDNLSPILTPLKVYVLSLEEIRDGKVPTEQNYAAWQYLALLGPDVGLAHRVNQKAGGVPVFAGISYGRQAASALRARQQLTTVNGLPDGAYEARRLSIPGLLTESFWLKAAASNDMVLAYDSNASGVRLMNPYPMTDFLNILKPLALARLKFAALAGPAAIKDVGH